MCAFTSKIRSFGIVNFGGVSTQRLTNIRSSINEKLFHEQGAKSLDSNIRRIK